ncbi:MAG: transglycosylase domain-containing protein [bacterium]
MSRWSLRLWQWQSRLYEFVRFASIDLSRGVRSLVEKVRLFSTRIASTWRRSLQAKLLVILTVLLVALLIAVVYPYVATYWVFDWYQYQHERSVCGSMFDSEGRFLGPLANVLEPDVTYGYYPSPDHLTLWPDSIPYGFRECLTALEDRHVGTWRCIHGVDIGAFVRAVFIDLPRGTRSGGSGIAMQLVRSIRHSSIGSQETLWGKLVRKSMEIRHAAVLYTNLGRDGIFEWSALHVPLAVGAPGSRFGGSLYGIELTSQIVFGHPAAECSVAEAALLAAAFSRPFILEPTDRGWRVEQSRYEYLRQRAASGVQMAIADSLRQRTALRELEDLQTLEFELPAELRSTLAGSSAERLRTLAHPVRRSSYFCRGSLIEVRRLLKRAGYWTDRPQIRSARLTLDGFRNAELEQRIEWELGWLWTRQSANLWLPWHETGGQSKVANVLVVAAEATQGIGFHYSNTHIPALDPQMTNLLQVGSLGKVVIAIALGAAGDSVAARYCNMSCGELHNPGGDPGVLDCSEPGAWYRADEVFAHSLNLPLLWRSNQSLDSHLVQLSRGLNLTLPHDSPATVSLVYGFATANAIGLLDLMGSLNSVLFAGTTGGWSGTRLIESVEETKLSGDTSFFVGNDFTSLLSDALDDPESRLFVREVLSAPLRPGGTLQRLCDWSAERHPAVVQHLSKSGTVVDAGGDVVSLLVAGSLVLQSGAAGGESCWSYLVVIRSPDPSVKLGAAQLDAACLAPLVRALLEEISRQYTSSHTQLTVPPKEVPQ